MVVYMDESGDLGFSHKKGNSKYFLVTFLASEEQDRIEKVVKRVHQALRKKVKQLSGGVLHCTKEKPVTRKRLLNRLVESRPAIMTIVLDKSRVFTDLREEKHVLYNYVTNILIDRIMTRKLLPTGKTVTIIAAKRETNKFLNENFKSYLETQARKNHKIEITVAIRTPAEEKGLQAADFVCWAMFQKHEKQDPTYYNLIKSLVKEESYLFK